MSDNQQLFYIQNIGCFGNCLRWWKDGGHGYTSNLDEAWQVPYNKALAICESRPEKDFPRLVTIVDSVSERHVDAQVLTDQILALYPIASNAKKGE